MTVTLSYEVRSIDCEKYKEIFPTSQILEDASKMKREAVKNGEYENAAHYRDLEKRVLRNILLDFWSRQVGQILCDRGTYLRNTLNPLTLILEV